MRLACFVFCLTFMVSLVFFTNAMQQRFIPQEIIKIPDGFIKKITFKPAADTNEQLLAIHHHDYSESGENTISFTKVPDNLAALTSLPLYFAPIVEHAWSSDGTLLAVLRNNRNLQIFNTTNSAVAHWLTVLNIFLDLPVRGMCFNRSTKHLAIAFDTKVQTFALSGLDSLHGHAELMLVSTMNLPERLDQKVTCSFNNVGNLLLCGIHLIDAANNELFILQNDELLARTLSKNCAAWHPLDSVIAIKKYSDVYNGVYDEICFINAERHEIVPTEKKIADMCWSPDGQLLAVSATDGSISLLYVLGDKTIAMLRRTLQATSLAWSSDGSYIAAAGNNAIQLWQVKNCKRTISAVTVPNLFATQNYSYLMALVYCLSAVTEKSKQKMPYNFVEDACIQDSQKPLIVPALLLLGIFWKNLQNKHKNNALECMHKNASEQLMVSNPRAEALLKELLKQLSSNALYLHLTKPLTIKIALQTFCNECSTAQEIAISLSIITVMPQRCLALEKLLDVFFERSINKTLKCSQCLCQGTTCVKGSISEAPEVIVMVLNRFYNYEEQEHCNLAQCPIPVDNLNIAQFGNYGTNGENYFLRAFIACSSDVQKEGSEIAYIRNADKWYCYDQKQCTVVEQATIDSLEKGLPLPNDFLPNILFYQKDSSL